MTIEELKALSDSRSPLADGADSVMASARDMAIMDLAPEIIALVEAANGDWVIPSSFDRLCLVRALNALNAKLESL